MKNLILLPVSFFFIINGYAQQAHKFSVYVSFLINKTLYDRTITNNATGWGFSVQSFLKPNNKIILSGEFTASVFGGTKEFYMTADGKPIYAKEEVYTAFFGPAFPVSKRFYLSAFAGLAFLPPVAYPGVKTSMVFFFSKKHIIAANISFTNIFQRDNISNKSFGFFNAGIGIKFF